MRRCWARLVAVALAWRRRDKDSLKLLPQASSRSLARGVEVAVMKIAHPILASIRATLDTRLAH